ncbi:tRNA preQ1(34) S-adenosylmethionine ribosyltransferase-isomerase QueA [Candidatus Saccharibacteria bacterium]|nr:tRNA preQ1(34) S-adenosylmethionine ribosyltransferase-isomerase QueA [Candidatus Saccharibacteria bacterium]
MLLSDYSYNLPDELIAKHPPKVRGSSRLLLLDRKNQTLVDSKYANLADSLNPGDLLILNNTRVIPSRLQVTKRNGAKREIILLERHSNDNYHSHRIMYRGSLSTSDELFLYDDEPNTTSQESMTWPSGPERSPECGTSVRHPHLDKEMTRENRPVIIIKKILGDGIAVARSLDPNKTLLDLALTQGTVPLPPYLNRNANESDRRRYQTVFAEQSGSAAAPTASLNFTNELKSNLETRGVSVAYLTLHVGLGTFLPIRSESIKDHKMHQEYFEIPAETIAAINSAKSNNKKVIALGTTVARTLEYAAKDLETATSSLHGEADIFIYPGYKFQIVDGLLTNFHAPKSTVLMLAGAFAGWDFLLRAYEHAISEHYQFLSYGDSMLIL